MYQKTYSSLITLKNLYEKTFTPSLIDRLNTLYERKTEPEKKGKLETLQDAFLLTHMKSI